MIAVGVPLKNIMTNRRALSSLWTSPDLVMRWTSRTPMTGRTTIFAIVVRKIAIIGSRESGRGILMRAKLAPRRMRASGTAIPPRKLAERRADQVGPCVAQQSEIRGRTGIDEES